MTRIQPARFAGAALRVAPRPRMLASSSWLEALLAFVAAVLGVLGLMGVAPLALSASGVLSIAASLVMDAATLASRFQRQLAGRFERSETVEITVGISAELMCGTAGFGFGLLALVGVVPAFTLGLAALVLGTALLLGAAANSELENLVTRAEPSSSAREGARRAVHAVDSARAVLGVACLTLGGLSLAGAAAPAPWLMPLAVVLSASGLLLGAIAVGSRMALPQRARARSARG